MIIKDNKNRYGLKKEADGYSIVDFKTMQIIGKLDNDFEGETDDCFVKYDTKKDILYFDKKVKVISNYDTSKYDVMPHEDYERAEDGTERKAFMVGGY